MRGTAVRVVLMLAALFCAAPTLANEARILEADDREITIELATDDYALERVVHGGEPFFRVRAPGYGGTDAVGLPLLPLQGALLGVPFGARVSLEIVSIESENLGPRRVEPMPLESFVREGDFAVPTQEYEPEAEFYRGRGVFPEEVARLGFDSVLRHQRVVQVVFHPFQYAASTGELTLHSRIVVKLRIEGGGRVEGMRPVVAHEPQWDAVLAGTVLNYRQAGRWLARPEPRRSGGADDGAGDATPSRADHESYRIEVGETGIHRLDFADLAAEGLAGTLDVDTVAVFQCSFDAEAGDPFVETAVPVVVVDEDENGLFDGFDYVLFHGRSFFDQYVELGTEDSYDTGNVYWFGWGEGLAARMPTRTAWQAAGGLTAPASFRDTLRFEEDIYFDSRPVSGFIDLYHMTDFDRLGGDIYSLPFSLPDIDPSEDMIFTARYQGMRSGNHRIDFTVENGQGQENYIGYFYFTGESFTMEEDIFSSGSIPSSYFTDGQNTLKTEGSLGSALSSNADLDWFTWSYLREYDTHGGRLTFSNARLTGLQQFEVSGFAIDDIRAFDVTHAGEPVEIALQAENIESDVGGYKLVLQEVVPGYTRYEAGESSAFLEPLSIDRTEPVGLATAEADVIVVSYDSFAPSVEPLIARRESEGYVVAHALLSEVYDEFGGGLPGPQALRNYFMYAFEEWERQPQFVLLVGDGSEDTREVDPDSSPNFMPTYLFLAGDDKILASDQWYISRHDGTYLPQMFIGRLPASGPNQLGNFISKIALYESYSAADSWRNNVLFIADDQWSYVTETAPYSYKGYEDEFANVSLELADVIASSPADIDTTLFVLGRYTQPYHGGTTSGDVWYAFETAQWVRTQGAQADLIEMINDGASLVNFEGHGNRSQLTHEQLLLASSASSANDMSLLQNEDKPFVFLGFSCELARFHDSLEGRTIDCVMEQMMQREGGRGAVATYACSGVAFLTPNARLHRKVYEAFFTDPTPAGDEIYFWPRWSIGGTLAKGTVKYITNYGSGQLPQTYVLLGDPLMHVEMSPPSIQVTIDGEPHVSGDFLEATEGDVTLVADIIDEVEIDPASIALEETDVGPIDASEYTVVAQTDTFGQQSRWYRLTYTAPIRSWIYDLKISATDANGSKTTFTLHVSEGQQVLIRDVANHPNPFDEDTRIIYLLNKSGSDVRIRIFTVGGRLIRVIEDAPGDLNYNQVYWDGRDQDGDEVASGVYLYVIDVTGDDGSTATSPVGKMARIGGMDSEATRRSRR